MESPQEVESKVPELMELASKGDMPALMKRVDEVYNLVGVQDVMDLREQAQQATGAASGGDAEAALNASPPYQVLEAIQASTEKRVADAKLKVEELIATKTGDVNQRIKKLLKGLDSPLPLLMVLQMNIAEAQYAKDDDAMRAFMHINTIVQEELEKKVSRVQALLNRLMRMDSESVRDNLLRHTLTPVQVAAVAPDFDGEETVSAPKLMGAQVPPSKLADAIANLVRNVDQQLQAVGTDEANEARLETLEKIRDIAIEARLVIGEVYDEGEMNRFGAALTPAFHTLMVYHQQKQVKDRMAAVAAEKGAAAAGPGDASQAPAEPAPGS